MACQAPARQQARPAALICIDFILGHQNHEFYEPGLIFFPNYFFYLNKLFINLAMQEKVLNHILSFFKSHAESRAEDIVSFVIKDIHENDRRDIRHIVDLLSGASCFQVNIQQ